MGVPTSSILSEFYLQHLENSKIYESTKLQYRGILPIRYVDDLLIIYNERRTDVEFFLYCFNNITPKLNFTIEKETRGSINFLDLTIHRDENRFSIDIYRKLTYTDPSAPATPPNISTLQYATYTTD
jgi:hypothetical protein